jgi:hypothetical protein
MRAHLLLLGWLLGMALGGCATVGSAGPQGFRDAACGATEHLLAAERQLTAAFDAVTMAEVERVAIAASGMKREADGASAFLGGAPPWEPGSPLVGELSEAAAEFARAATAFSIGARKGTGPEFDRALASGQAASAALARAAAESARLTGEVGWQPC